MKKTLYFIFLRIKNYFLVNECGFLFFVFCFKEQKTTFENNYKTMTKYFGI